MTNKIETGIDVLDMHDAVVPGRITVLVGPARSGKTLALARIAAALNVHGQHVVVRASPEFKKFDKLYNPAENKSTGKTYLMLSAMAHLEPRPAPGADPSVVLLDDIHTLTYDYHRGIGNSIAALRMIAQHGIAVIATYGTRSNIIEANVMPLDITNQFDNVFMLTRTNIAGQDGFPVVGMEMYNPK